MWHVSAHERRHRWGLGAEDWPTEHLLYWQASKEVGRRSRVVRHLPQSNKDHFLRVVRQQGRVTLPVPVSLVLVPMRHAFLRVVPGGRPFCMLSALGLGHLGHIIRLIGPILADGQEGCPRGPARLGTAGGMAELGW